MENKGADNSRRARPDEESELDQASNSSVPASNPSDTVRLPSGSDPKQEATSIAEEPNCSVCLDLQWDFFDIDPDAKSHERYLGVPYCDIIKSMRNGCEACGILSHAVSEFSKPLLQDDMNYLDVLLSSTLRIWLKLGYTTTVEIFEYHEDYEPFDTSPDFVLEIYTEVGTLR
jgi:hypothetical protein